MVKGLRPWPSERADSRVCISLHLLSSRCASRFPRTPSKPIVACRPPKHFYGFLYIPPFFALFFGFWLLPGGEYISLVDADAVPTFLVFWFFRQTELFRHILLHVTHRLPVAGCLLVGSAQFLDIFAVMPWLAPSFLFCCLYIVFCILFCQCAISAAAYFGASFLSSALPGSDDLIRSIRLCVSIHSTHVCVCLWQGKH